MPTEYHTRAGEMLDLICHQHYGLQSGAVEAVLAANPRLADHGPVLPDGLVITLPDLAQPRREEQLISLWD